MKTKVLFVFLVAVFLSSGTSVLAQEESQKEEFKTLFAKSNGHINHGGYAAITIGYAEIDKRAALEIGGRLAWLINHQFAFGFAGKSFFNDIDNASTDPANDYYLAGGYGGLFFQPIIFPKAPVHVSFPIILGVGGIALYPNEPNNNYHWEEDYYHSDSYDSDVFLVFEPGVDVEFNMLRYMRMSLGVSYRFTNKVNLVYAYDKDIMNPTKIDDGVLNNLSINMAIMFGWF